MKYYAHSTENKEDTWQLLKEHLENTADYVKEFSSGFCGENIAENIGLLHDVGKYQISFQNRLNGSKIPVEHSNAGAKIWGFIVSQYCIAGHHTGLMDIGAKTDDENKDTLYARLKREVKDDISYFKNEINLKEPTPSDCPKNMDFRKTNKDIAFFIRFMFSCLTDADFLDTELFYNPKIERGIKADFKVLLKQINAKIDDFEIDTQVKKVRNNLRLQVISHIKNQSEIYFLNMPTGSGKTLTSMQFALNRAVEDNKKHIIYVIPFTSITSQNAKVFKDIFGDNIVLEHHSNFEYDEKDINEKNLEYNEINLLKKASENWDCPITVTTNVQFFESIYSNKSSKLRKLHNIANSIIVFDEVHMFPGQFFKPCLDAIQSLTSHYNCEAVFMSATMPNFNVWLDKFNCKNVKTLDLIEDKSEFSAFERSEIVNLGEVSLDNLLSNIKDKSLIVVNKKKTAKEIYDKLNGKKFHLSTYMTHYDRDRTIQQVKIALENDEPFCLVSTSLIEAGVDLDFDTVYRELLGLDNLIQTAGRCNREGKKTGAITYSFELIGNEYAMKNDEVQHKQRFTKDVFSLYNSFNDMDSINYYFDMLYDYNIKTMSSMDFQTAITCNGYNFKSYAEKFKIIDDNSVSIVIPNEDVFKLIEKFQYNSKTLKRKLQRYSISLKIYEYNELVNLGVLSEKNDVMVLDNANFYNENTGIIFEDNNDYIY